MSYVEEFILTIDRWDHFVISAMYYYDELAIDIYKRPAPYSYPKQLSCTFESI